MCSSSQSNVGAIRRVQLLIAFCAWPCALAAVLKSHKSPETILQIVMVRVNIVVSIERNSSDRT